MQGSVSHIRTCAVPRLLQKTHTLDPQIHSHMCRRRTVNCACGHWVECGIDRCQRFLDRQTPRYGPQIESQYANSCVDTSHLATSAQPVNRPCQRCIRRPSTVERYATTGSVPLHHPRARHYSASARVRDWEQEAEKTQRSSSRTRCKEPGRSLGGLARPATGSERRKGSRSGSIKG